MFVTFFISDLNFCNLDDQATREKCGEVEDVYEYCNDPVCADLENGGICDGHISRTFLKECNDQCGCRPNCSNRVVQRGLTRRLQVCTYHCSISAGMS